MLEVSYGKSIPLCRKSENDQQKMSISKTLETMRLICLTLGLIL